MAARAISSATVSFGLVSIPVKLYSATESSEQISFNLLHKDCGSRLKQQYVCAKDNQPVARDQMVKGYEFAKDQYVIFTTEELKELEEKATQTVEITEFVPVAKVDPIYFDRAYFLGPDKGGDKAYRLLAKAMTESGHAALAKYAARGRQYLVMLRPTPDFKLVMQQLHYADEVRSTNDVPANEVDIKDAELKLALQLIGQIATEAFKPDAYEDEVRKRTKDLIQKRIEGQQISISPTEEPKAQIIDLMEALKASLSKAPANEPAKAEAPTAAPAEAVAEAAVAGERKAPKRSPRQPEKKAAKAK
jgi:DNA end-binding protein Ku